MDANRANGNWCFVVFTLNCYVRQRYVHLQPSGNVPSHEPTCIQWGAVNALMQTYSPNNVRHRGWRPGHYVHGTSFIKTVVVFWLAVLHHRHIHILHSLLLFRFRMIFPSSSSLFYA